MPPPQPLPWPALDDPDRRPRNLAGGGLDEARKRLGASSRHALIIAPGTHEVPQLNLPAVPEDARAIRDLLLAPDCGCFPDGNVEVLQGQAANERNIRERLDALAQAAGTHGLAFILFLGHAVVEDGETYFVTHETRCGNLFSTSLSKHALQGCMRRFKTKCLFLVMDCCHAGQFADLLPQRTRSLLSGEDLLNQFSGEGRVILAAAGHDEKAGEGKRGFLSQALEEGLRGEADTKGSGVVTLDDLWPFVNRRVAELGTQRPRLIGDYTNGFVLSLNQAHVRQREAESRRLQQATEAIDRWTRGPREVRLLQEEADAAQRVLQMPEASSALPEHIALRQVVLQSSDSPVCPAAVKVLAYHVHCDHVHGPRATHQGKLDGMETVNRILSDGLLANKEESARLRRELEAAREACQALELARDAREQELLHARSQIAQVEARLRETEDAAQHARAEAERHAAMADAARQALEQAGDAREQELLHARSQVAQVEARLRETEDAAQHARAEAERRAAVADAALRAEAALVQSREEHQRQAQADARRLAQSQAALAAAGLQVQQLDQDYRVARQELAHLHETRQALEERARQAESKAGTLATRLAQAQPPAAADPAPPRHSGRGGGAAAGIFGLGFLLALVWGFDQHLRYQGLIKTWPPPSPDQTTRAHPFTNSLGMKFVPVTTDGPSQILFSVWETRVQDYAVFLRENPGHDAGWQGQNFTPPPTHPVARVSWQDARDYAQWLTQRERQKRILAPEQSYRLPTDLEWSAGVLLSGETGTTPKERDGKISGVHPWGRAWPPPRLAGNFADARFKEVFPEEQDLIRYADDFASTAPVGSFAPLANGLHDLSGNLWEWCEDTYDGDPERRVLRGGSWNTHHRTMLLSSYRHYYPPGARFSNVGFRLVLVVARPTR